MGAAARLCVGLENVCQAAKSGHLDVLQWAWEHHCPWDAWMCATAAGDGHRNALLSAREHRCPWDEVPDDNDLHLLRTRR